MPLWEKQNPLTHRPGPFPSISLVQLCMPGSVFQSKCNGTGRAASSRLGGYKWKCSMSLPGTPRLRASSRLCHTRLRYGAFVLRPVGASGEGRRDCPILTVSAGRCPNVGEVCGPVQGLEPGPGPGGGGLNFCQTVRSFINTPRSPLAAQQSQREWLSAHMAPPCWSQAQKVDMASPAGSGAPELRMRTCAHTGLIPR